MLSSHSVLAADLVSEDNGERADGISVGDGRNGLIFHGLG